jgi:transposase
MARRSYSREFKVSAVKLVTEQGYSVSEAAKSLGIDRASISYWVKKFSGESGNGAVVPEGSLKAEVRRLREENKRLRLEREILKKATAFFAKEQP